MWSIIPQRGCGDAGRKGDASVAVKRHLCVSNSQFSRCIQD